MNQLRALCSRDEVVLISDEVFRPYGFARGDLPTLAPAKGDAGGPPLTVVLDGLSKRGGLPQLKVSWMLLHGAPEAVAQAREGLAWIADTQLSVAAPVQAALPQILALARQMERQIRSRVRQNRQILEEMLQPLPAARLLPADGGWSALLRVPALVSEEEWVRFLATSHGVRVQPGYFYDLAYGPCLVLSLLPGPVTFREGVDRLCSGLRAQFRDT